MQKIMSFRETVTTNKLPESIVEQGIKRAGQLEQGLNRDPKGDQSLQQERVVTARNMHDIEEEHPPHHGDIGGNGDDAAKMI